MRRSSFVRLPCRAVPLLLTAALAACTTTPRWEPDPARCAALDRVLDAAVAHGRLPGVVALVTTADGVVYEHAAGVLDPVGDLPMRADAIFNIASMTKPITSLGVLMLVEEGRIALDEPASRYLPELAGREVLVAVDPDARTFRTCPATREVTVRDLLRHTSGIAYSFSNRELHELEQVTDLADRLQPLVHDPGARWTYGMGTAQLGWILEHVSGQPLEAFLRERILGPLGMDDTSFSVPAEKATRLAAVFRTKDGVRRARPRPASVEGEPRGDGDLYSTARDYARFVQLVLAGGQLGSVRLLSEARLAEMTRDQLEGRTVVEQPAVMPGLAQAFPLGAGRDGFSLGFQVAAGDPDGRADGSLSWAGLFNTHFWIDPANGVGVVLLTQVLPFYDPQVIEVLREFERAVYGVPAPGAADARGPTASPRR